MEKAGALMVPRAASYPAETMAAAHTNRCTYRNMKLILFQNKSVFLHRPGKVVETLLCLAGCVLQRSHALLPCRHAVRPGAQHVYVWWRASPTAQEDHCRPQRRYLFYLLRKPKGRMFASIRAINYTTTQTCDQDKLGFTCLMLTC